MEPVYRHIEFCRNHETLWEKLKAGYWDWLGVHKDGKFVLGSPRRSAASATHLGIKLVPNGATEGEHGVRTYTEPGGAADERWFFTEVDAQQAFADEVAKLRAQSEDRPVLAFVRRIEQMQPVEIEWVVTRPETYR